MNKSTKRPPASASISNPPSASVDDTAASLREAPVLTAVLSLLVPSKLPGRDATFAQQELRKLDGDLGAEADRALHQIASVDAATRETDFGPAVARLRGLDALVQRRADNAAVLTRLRYLLDYAEVQQRVFDHDTVLIIEAVGEAIAFLGQYDDSLRGRYHATLDVLAARQSKVTEGRARARAATPEPTPVPTPVD